MDVITHGLLGALTVRSLPRHQKISSKELTWLGFGAAVLPDVDYFLFWIQPMQFLAEWHRAATHSFVLMPVWSVVIGFVAAKIVKATWKWRPYALICGIAISTHILSDIITIYGTQVFNPLSDYKAVIGTTFPVDGYFTGIVLTGLMGSLLLARYKVHYQRKFAVLATFVLISYLGLQGYFRSLANEAAHRYVTQVQLNSVRIHSLPQPFSPTHWKVVIETKNSYYVSFINVLPAKWHQEFTRLMVGVLSANSEILIESAGRYLSENTAEWNSYQKIDDKDLQVLLAWNHEEFSAFRKFALLPVLYRKDQDNSGACVWFTDLRYVFPVMIPSFRYGMCNKNDTWYPYRLKQYTVNNRVPL